MEGGFKVAVITVSDSANQNKSLDTSGPLISSEFASKDGFKVIDARVVPDGIETIQSAVQELIMIGAELIITTGGTGFGPRDYTVKAIQPLLSQHAIGLTHAINVYGLQQTPLAALSNPFAGFIESPSAGDVSNQMKRTLIVALPGSRGGVKDGLQVLVGPKAGPMLHHALALIRGSPCPCSTCHPRIPISIQKTSTSTPSPPQTTDQSLLIPTPKSTSSELSVTGHSCGHDHDHHHHGPQSRAPKEDSSGNSVSARARVSPYEQISLEAALELISTKVGVLDVETIPCDHRMVGRILAEDIVAPHHLPLWQSTNVDGYAVCHEDGPGIYKVRHGKHLLPMKRGEIVRVNTGGPVPEGSDAIVMVEDTLVESILEDGEENEIKILCSSPKGDNIRAPGSDLKEGDVVMKKGELISGVGGEVGLICSVGRRNVKVIKRPKIAILSTGSELVDLQAPAIEGSTDDGKMSAHPGGWTGIYDSNRPSLFAALISMGFEVVDVGVVKDEQGAHETAMRVGLEAADVVITTGGTSMGEGDLIKPLLEHKLSATIHFGRVGIAPGKPTTFATIPPSTPGAPEKLFFALPGNPASALVTLFVFVLPALRSLGGWAKKDCSLQRTWVQLTHSIPLAPRLVFHRCTLKTQENGPPLATTTGGQRSSRVGSLKDAGGLIIVESGKGMIHAGDKRLCIILPNGSGISA